MTAAASYFFHGRTAFPTAVYDPLLTCFNTREYENALQTSGLVGTLFTARTLHDARGHGCVKILEIEIPSTHVESEPHPS